MEFDAGRSPLCASTTHGHGNGCAPMRVHLFTEDRLRFVATNTVSKAILQLHEREMQSKAALSAAETVGSE